MAGKAALYSKRTQLTVASLTVFYWLGIWTLFQSVPLFFEASAQTPAAVTSEGAPAPPVTPGAARETATEIELKSKDLDRQIAFVETRLGYIEKLLAALVTVGTVFGLALGLTSYLNVKELQKSAEAALAEVKKDAEGSVEKVRRQSRDDLAEIRADFPAIARMNRQVEKILAELKSVVFREWSQTSYTQLPERERQEIILLELAFRNVLVLFEHRAASAYARMIIEIHRGFGRFYSSRYTSGKGADSAARARAILYLEAAAIIQEPDIYADVQGDFGILYALESGFTTGQVAKADLQRQAGKCLRQALEHDPKSPRYLQALGWIERREGRLDLAIEHLNTLITILTGLDVANSDRKRYLWPAHHNRACYRIRNVRQLAHNDPARIRQEEEALQDLLAARKTAAQYDELKDWTKALRADLQCTSAGNEAGDLAPEGGLTAVAVRMAALAA